MSTDAVGLWLRAFVSISFTDDRNDGYQALLALKYRHGRDVGVPFDWIVKQHAYANRAGEPQEEPR